MKSWHIGFHSRDIYGSPAVLDVSEFPWWAGAAEWLVEWIDAKSGHLLCNPPGWTYRVPLSLKRDEDGDWDRSLGLALFSLLNKSLTFPVTLRTTHHQFHVTDEWLAENGYVDPLDDYDYEDDDDDEFNRWLVELAARMSKPEDVFGPLDTETVTRSTLYNDAWAFGYDDARADAVMPLFEDMREDYKQGYRAGVAAWELRDAS